MKFTKPTNPQKEKSGIILHVGENVCKSCKPYIHHQQIKFTQPTNQAAKGKVWYHYAYRRKCVQKL